MGSSSKQRQQRRKKKERRRVRRQKNKKKVDTFYKNYPLASEMDCACKLHLTRAEVRTCKKLCNLITIKRKKIPYRTAEKCAQIKTRALRLYRSILSKRSDKVIIMDDETYVYYRTDNTGYSKFYTRKKGQKLPLCIACKGVEKYPKKVMIWQFITSTGYISKPVIINKNLNGEGYLQLMKKKLVPFIKANGGHSKFLFWPDLASCHYAKKVINYLRSEDIDFVDKFENPPSTPELRPIEDFWHLAKMAFHKQPNYPKSMHGFKSKWSRACRNVSPDVVRNMFSTIKKKIRLVGQFGISALINSKTK